MAHTFAELTQLTPDALEAVLAAGTTPLFSSIVDHEFRGWNVFSGAVVGAVGGVLGIQRFAKGFFVRGNGDLNAAAVDALPFVEGYNVKVRRGTSSEPWTAVPDDQQPTRFGFFRVERANDGVARLGRHPQALLLDYSQGSPKPSVVDGSGLRDFVVQVDADNPDLLLGKAYMHVGPVASAVGFFVLERLRRSGFRP